MPNSKESCITVIVLRQALHSIRVVASTLDFAQIGIECVVSLPVSHLTLRILLLVPAMHVLLSIHGRLVINMKDQVLLPVELRVYAFRANDHVGAALAIRLNESVLGNVGCLHFRDWPS